MTNKHGYTLTEVVVVLAIIVILLGVMIPGLSYFQNKKTENTVVELNRMLNQSVVAYYAMSGEYPTDSLFTTGRYLDINEANASKVVQRIYDITGAHLQKEYSYKKFKMNVNVVNKYITKIEFENR